VLIVKGRSVAFDLEDREILVRRSSGLMHDPTGRSWPRCSLLIGPFQRGRAARSDAPSYRDAQSYFGRDAEVRQGEVDPPPRPLASWKRLGTVEQIWYTRAGMRYRHRGKPSPFRHPFNEPGILTRLFRGKGRRPVLYAHGRFLRLEMQRGCILDARGIVWP
jgi:hypothetical protein